MVGLSGEQPVIAQAPEAEVGGGNGDFSARIRDPREVAVPVEVAVGRQIIIETSMPFDRVEATKAEIVRLTVLDPTKLLVTGEKYGVTQVMVYTDDGAQHVFEVTVELDLELLNKQITRLDPQSDAQALSIYGNVLLIGNVSGADVAEQVFRMATMFIPNVAGGEIRVENLLTIAAEQQVFLKCVVAEVSRTAVRRLGVNGFLAGENFRDGFLVNNLGGFNPTNIQPVAGTNLRTPSPIPFTLGDIPITPQSALVLGFPRANLELFIRAMADNQLSRILAEPTLVAVSGEEAKFLVGGEFPVPIPQGGSNAGAITIEYKEFGVNLTFTPLVLPNQRIRLTVAPEISARDEARGLVTATGFVPAVTTRRVETTVELDSGSTISIAGLLQDDIRGVTSGIPGLGELPVLGPLFRSVEYQRQRTELVVLVTPEIASALTPDQVPNVPGQDIRDPTDVELYFLGVLEGADPEVEDSMDADPLDVDGMMEDTELAERRARWRSEPNQLSLHGPWGPAKPDEDFETRTAERP